MSRRSSEAYQDREFRDIQAQRPCCYRGPQQRNVRNEPASPCCKAKEIVLSSKFYCSALNKTYNDVQPCWGCSHRKEVLPTSPETEPQ